MFPGVEIIHPPNNTMSEPLKDMNYEGFVRACGLFLLVFGAVISAISVLGLVGTFRKSRRLTITVLIAAYYINFLIIDLHKLSLYLISKLYTAILS